MRDNDISRIIALVATVLIGVVMFLFLYFCPVIAAVSDSDKPEKGEIALLDEEEVEEEFIDVLDPVPAGDVADESSPAQLDEPVVEQSQATPEGGTDLRDNGKQGDRPPVVTQTQPSPVQTKKEEPKPKPNPGPAQNTPSEDPNVKRQAQNDVAGKLNKGKSNAQTSDVADNGNSGANTALVGTASMTGLQGSGWIFPAYGAIKSPVAGSIKATVKIDASGNVTSVVITGGDPPAATNPTVCAAVKRELSRKFSRANYADAQPATAYVTYRFR